MKKCNPGFTLIEVLIAMVLVVAVLGPTSAWLFKNRSNQSAHNRLQALMELEKEISKSFRGPLPVSGRTVTLLPTNDSLIVSVQIIAHEHRVMGSVVRADGEVLAELAYLRFAPMGSMGQEASP